MQWKSLVHLVGSILFIPWLVFGLAIDLFMCGVIGTSMRGIISWDNPLNAAVQGIGALLVICGTVVIGLVLFRAVQGLIADLRRVRRTNIGKN